MAKMSNEDKKKKVEDLEKLYEEARLGGGDLNDMELIANPNDLVNDEDIVHDYEQDLKDAIAESEKVVDSMASLYLNDNEKILSHPYLEKKRKHDSANHADMSFLQKVAKRAIIKQLQQMDQGDLSPRHFETFYNGMKEIRENIKQATSTQATMESFYKLIRDDLGMEGNIGGENTQSEIEDAKPDNLDLNMLDPKDMNNKLDQIILQMNEDKDKKK